ncbi:hypothetical protein Dsin_028818 [Dipteronia sinensis]|uniref:Uncharacterized protein n=1 Tax=Dipteronia sinensis TaxID=43782 RepID=A0AAD9ZRH9_9ROSI|nr:hypothetical protein Dsin_028818 [Dipteronia sinensis]
MSKQFRQHEHDPHLCENKEFYAVSNFRWLVALDRQENKLTFMAADIIQSLIPEHDIVGFVVGTDYERHDRISALYEQDGRRGLGLNICGYRTNPYSSKQM